MNIAILYGHRKPRMGRASYDQVTKGANARVYVRMDVLEVPARVEGVLSWALSKAKPWPGEVVLNTMEID